MLLRSRTGLGVLIHTQATIDGIVYGMEKEAARENLRRAALNLRSHDAVRDMLKRERDKALADARAAGVTWVEMQSDSGLTVGSVRTVLARAKK